MSIDLAKAIWARLTDQCATAEGVYPLRLPDDADYPALVYQQLTGPRGYTLTGEAGPHRTTWQITAWGETYSDAKTLAGEAIAALSAWVEESGDNVTDAVAFVASEFDLFDPDSRLYYVPIDATILFVP